MKKALFIGLYKGTTTGHGGERRTCQLREIIAENRYDVNHIAVSFSNFIGKLYRLPIITAAYYKNIKLASPHVKKPLLSKYTVKEALRMQRMDKFIEDNKQAIQNADTIFFENSFPDFIYLPFLIKQKFNKKVVACLHNIEALVPLQNIGLDASNQNNHLLKELDALSLCDSVFTISREEQWFLNLFKINAHYLPYYPNSVLLNQLQNIREKRSNAINKKGFLIVGSVTNPPTRKGIEQLLDFLMQLHFTNNTEIYLAGFGTDLLAEKYQHPNIKIKGAVSDTELEALMIECKAAIVNQGFSTGALTKNIEFLIAGIPIFSDEGSARSYYGVDGIYVYKDFQNLVDLINEDLPVPPIPEMPNDDYDKFTRTVA